MNDLFVCWLVFSFRHSVVTKAALFCLSFYLFHFPTEICACLSSLEIIAIDLQL